MSSAHIDTFANDNLPPVEQQPEFLFTLPELQYPEQLNCAWPLLDQHVAEGRGDRTCLMAPGGLHWTYAELQDKANRIARVLVEDMGLVPGNRVLLRSPNNPMLVACWFAVMKAGGIAVTTMPLLRAKELGQMIPKGRISHALCDLRLAEELQQAQAIHPVLQHIRYFFDDSEVGLEALMAAKDGAFTNVDTASTDTCLLAFTSGTTGEPKGTMHFHRDVMSICLCWPPHVLRPNADDIFIGSPPLGFTFGLGGLVLFPMLFGASAVLLEKAAPALLLDAVREFKATVLFTAPTSYRVIAQTAADLRGSALRKCVSAGEALPAATRKLWKDVTGIELIDGIGATEMLHIFVSADEANARPGATGKAVPGYIAQVMTEQGEPAGVGEVGKLAVKGPTGCRYLDDARQRNYVKNGWNYTGDAYVMDADGYLHYQARTDDMIISSGYNIASPEVEDAMLAHAWVSECGVIGVADGDRGQIVKAFVVLTADAPANEETVKILQDFVKATVAPYKYPRAIEFRKTLPRTESGKLQRFRLRDPE
jgi:2-aminobenzoate-CoA ligase